VKVELYFGESRRRKELKRRMLESESWVFNQANAVLERIAYRGHLYAAAYVLDGRTDFRAAFDEMFDGLLDLRHAPICNSASWTGFGVRIQSELVPADVEAHVEGFVEVGPNAKGCGVPLLGFADVANAVNDLCVTRESLEQLLDNYFVYVVSVNPRLAFRGADNLESLPEVGFQCDLIIRPHIGEELFVPFRPCSLERRLKKLPGDPLTPSRLIDERSDDPDVVECVGIGREGVYGLTADDRRIVELGNEEYSTGRKTANEVSFFLDSDDGVQGAEAPGSDHLVQNDGYGAHIVRSNFSDFQLHAQMVRRVSLSNKIRREQS
jgi:hypothetical protein